jgi:HAD superfamily hydrolase (TIGR01509 family)
MEQLGRRKDELYAVAAQQLTTKPGISRMLSELNSSGILCALATSAGRTRAHESLEQFSITKQFSLIVTGEDAAVAKPAPEIFLLAADKLGVVKPQECIVVEDSVAGVEAARAAGMRCVGYALPRFAASLAEAGADDVISEFPKDSPTYFKHLVSSNGSQRLALQHGSPRARGR